MYQILLPAVAAFVGTSDLVLERVISPDVKARRTDDLSVQETAGEILVAAYPWTGRGSGAALALIATSWAESRVCRIAGGDWSDERKRYDSIGVFQFNRHAGMGKDTSLRLLFLPTYQTVQVCLAAEAAAPGWGKMSAPDALEILSNRVIRPAMSLRADRVKFLTDSGVRALAGV